MSALILNVGRLTPCCLGHSSDPPSRFEDPWLFVPRPMRLEVIILECSADGVHWMPLAPDIYDLTAKPLFPRWAPLDGDPVQAWRVMPGPPATPRLVLRL